MKELGQNLWGKIHILEDAPIYIQYIFRDMLHRVNGRRHTGSIQIEYSIEYLEYFLWKYTPRSEYSMMVGTTRPTSMMKTFVAPLKPPPLFSWIGLDQLSLVGLDLLGVSAINVGAEAPYELSVTALRLHRSDTKWLELFPSGHGWHSPLKFSLLPSAEKVFRGQMMLSTVNPIGLTKTWSKSSCKLFMK